MYGHDIPRTGNKYNSKLKIRIPASHKSPESQISYFQFQAIVNANVSTWPLSVQFSVLRPLVCAPCHPCHFRSVRTIRKISGMSTRRQDQDIWYNTNREGAVEKGETKTKKAKRAMVTRHRTFNVNVLSTNVKWPLSRTTGSQQMGGGGPPPTPSTRN